MSCTKSTARAFAAALLFVIPASPADATAQRTFVASYGVDVNACSLVSPCRSFGVALAKGNSLTACVNKAISSLRADGTLKRLQQLWLAKATGAPILK